jgi:homogentisate 1,2-dioxygenase
MPFYHKLGEIPRVKHTTFFKDDQKSLYREELVSSKGFSGIYSNLYHHHLPPALTEIGPAKLLADLSWPDAPFTYFHCDTDKNTSGGNFITAREEYLRNSSTRISLARVSEVTDDLYRNAGQAEFIFVHRGSGVLLSPYGKNPFGPGDQIVIPRGTIYQLKFDDYKNNKLLFIESSTPFEIPKHFKNEAGQLAEHAPYCERDLRPPEFMEPRLEQGAFKLVVKNNDRLNAHVVPHHPFDVVGWDGYLYPFVFNIKDYHAKVGRIHLPPPVHLLYTTESLVICNFVPRPFDFHEQAIPAPYYHNNIDSDEVLYYLDGDFMSRKGISEGSLTIHPGGIPHGPQPGRTEASVGQPGTNEYALMIDTFEALKPSTRVRDTMNDTYPQSWL